MSCSGRRAHRLRSVLQTPLPSRVAMSSHAGKRKAIAKILVGGHHDTVPGSPGGNDNSSGTAHVIELARLLAADGLDEGLCFATFGAEELGLLGSDYLAGEWEELGVLPRFMVNLDVTGTGDVVAVIGTERLVDQALAIAVGLEVPAAESSLPPNAGSDHSSFEVSRRGGRVLHVRPLRRDSHAQRHVGPGPRS